MILSKDFLAGLLFSAVGVAFFVASGHHEIGDATAMGPGYFPRVLSIIMLVLGAIITLQSVLSSSEARESFGSVAWRPLCFIILSNLVFGVCIGGLPDYGIPKLGLVIGVVLLTFCASFAHRDFSWKTTALVSAVLCVGSYVLFIRFLSQNIPVWPELS